MVFVAAALSYLYGKKLKKATAQEPTARSTMAQHDAPAASEGASTHSEPLLRGASERDPFDAEVRLQKGEGGRLSEQYAGDGSKSLHANPAAENDDTSVALLGVFPWYMTVAFFLLMLTRAGLVVYGLLSYWDRVNLKGSVTKVEGDDSYDDASSPVPELVSDFDVEVYIATFWINVKQFWEADSQTMAVLIYFSGVVQPMIQMVSACAIAFTPLSRETRHRMITLQEVTCKVPLSAFYVEAYLLIVFAFKVQLEYIVQLPLKVENYESKGDVIITGFIGLALFLIGQLLFLVIVNFLRLLHRNQKECDKPVELPEGSVETASAHRGQELGPSPLRPMGRKFVVLAVASGLIASLWYVCKNEFITFKYTGVVKPYIELKGGTNDDGEVELSLNLWEVVFRLKDDLVPRSYALFYCVAAALILLANPLALAVTAIVDVCLPDHYMGSRRFVGGAIELLQCWCGGEAIVVASFFLGPNIELITLFVFDDSDVCDNIDNATGKECLVVSGGLDPGSGSALVTYAVLAIILSRMCVGELYGYFGYGKGTSFIEV